MDNLKEKKEHIEDLVIKAQGGDHDAFSELYDLFIDPIYRYVYFRVNERDVEDIVENVFLKVWQFLHKYEHKKNTWFSSWIYRVAHNLVVDYYRKAKTREYDELNQDFVDDRREHSPIRNTENALDNTILKEAISTLKKSYQDVVVYKFINDLTNEEIASIMSKSEGSIRILQFRALKALKEELTSRGIKYSF